MRLNLRSKRKKRLPSREPKVLLWPIRPNITWSLDFMHDTLENGKTIRTLNIIDDFNREALAIKVDHNMPSSRVIKELDRLIQWRGKPMAIRSDNGPEFISNAMDEWCKKQGIEWKYTQPGKPTQNSFIERFNRTFRQDVLDAYMFDNLKTANKYANAWAWMYNNERPHSALMNMTPNDFLLKYGKGNNFPVLQRDHGDNYNWNSLVLNVAV